MAPVADYRLQQLGFEHLPIGFFDARAGAPCERQVLPTGDYACVPQSTPGSSLYYLDPACTEPVIVRDGATGAVESETCYQGAITVFDTSSADGSVLAYQPGDRVELPAHGTEPPISDPTFPFPGPIPGQPMANAYSRRFGSCEPTAVSSPAFQALPNGQFQAATLRLTKR